MVRRWCAGLAFVAGAVGLTAAVTAAAGAAPAEPQPLRERYEPGETATVVGYTPWRGPLDGYLVVSSCRGATVPCIPVSEVESSALLAEPVPVGSFALEATAHEPRGLRMSLTFTVPADLAPGTYYLATCRRGGACRLGDRLHVGVDPPAGDRTVYHWPLDDPAIAQLPDDALLLGHDGEEVTAADVRAGITVGDPTRAAGPATEQGSVRTEDAPSSHDDHSRPPLLWLLAGAAAIAGGWALTRLGPARKQVHRTRS
jgi:hypothetical protein